MGKICDPPPFSGGQCLVQYHFEFTRITVSSPFEPAGRRVRVNRRDIGNRVFGRVVAINQPVYNPSFSTAQIFSITQENGTVRYANNGGGEYPLYFWMGGTTYRYEEIDFIRVDGLVDDCGDPPPTNCRCTPDSCRVDCADAPDGFCCIPHSLTNGLLQLIQN